MNNKFKFLACTVLGVVSFNACSIVFPYENEFSCQGGSDINYCASATTIYKNIDNGTIPTAENNYGKEKPSEQISSDLSDLEEENHELKLLLKATQAEKLRSDRKTILIEGDYLKDKKDMKQ